MKKISILLILLISLSSFGADKLTLHFFGESTCGQCFQLKSEILLPMVEKHNDSLEIIFHNIDDTTGFKEFYAMNKAYGIEDDRPQQLFFPDTVLKGFEEIDEGGKTLILEYLKDRSLWTKSTIDTNNLSFKNPEDKRFSLHYFDDINPDKVKDPSYIPNQTYAYIKQLEAKHKLENAVHYHSNEDVKYTAILEVLRKKDIPSHIRQKLAIGDTVLVGSKEIKALADSLIQKQIQTREKTSQKVLQDASKLSYDDIMEEKSKKIFFWGVTLAGLADGINPCAIATMIFLISFLATQKRPTKEVFIIGQSYILAVFVTYFLMGVSAFEALTKLKEYHFVSSIIRWSAVALASYVSFFSFYDAYKYAKTGKNKDIKLQLSKSLKMRIHKVISGNLSQRGLITGAIITGFFVTLLEAVCTGQMYLPIIQGMTESKGTRFQGWLWLVYYNILFVLPLQIVMIASYKGITWDVLAKKTQKNMVLLKIILGIVMLLLVVYLLKHAV